MTVPNKKLVVFGCSYSSGLLHLCNKQSWPSIFAQNNPEYEVVNYAMGGSSLQYSIAMLHRFLKTQVDLKNVTIIFQVTTPGRYTYNIEEILQSEQVFTTLNNYKQIKNIPEIKTIIPNWSRQKIKLDPRQLKLYQDRIKYYPSVCTDIEFESQVAYVKSICNFTFYHRRYESSIPQHLSVKYNDIPCIRSILGAEKFDEYAIDNGHHFGTDGLNYVANFIKDIIFD
jgi:hypothetical protein|tara:strand:+ start:493 stop:1173 length:681 start_codon:yes stop_codon:yes gene_type:complete